MSLDQPVGGRPHPGVVVPLPVGEEVVHVDEGGAFLRVRLAPGAKAAGPAEGARGAVHVAPGAAQQGPDPVAVAVARLVGVGVVRHLDLVENVRSHEVDGLAAHEPLSLIEAAVRQHGHQVAVVPHGGEKSGPAHLILLSGQEGPLKGQGEGRELVAVVDGVELHQPILGFL